MWLRDDLNKHVKYRKLINYSDILVNTVILATKEVIYIKRKIGKSLFSSWFIQFVYLAK